MYLLTIKNISIMCNCRKIHNRCLKIRHWRCNLENNSIPKIDHLRELTSPLHVFRLNQTRKKRKKQIISRYRTSNSKNRFFFCTTTQGGTFVLPFHRSLSQNSSRTSKRYLHSHNYYYYKQTIIRDLEKMNLPFESPSAMLIVATELEMMEPLCCSIVIITKEILEYM